MFNSKKIILSVWVMFAALLIHGADTSRVDALYDQGKYEEGLAVLEKMFDPSSPDAALVWRVSRLYYEIADAMPNKDKQNKINKFTDGMKRTEPHLDIKTGKAEDRAQIVFWYAALYGARGETIGIKESLDIIPDLFKLADKSISIDPEYAAPYLLKGRIDKAVPFFLGGDKFRMGVNFSQAIKKNPKDMNILVDASYAFYDRNWDADKKAGNSQKRGTPDGTPERMSDREYAKELAEKAAGLYKTFAKPTARDTMKYKEALNMLKRFK